MLRQNIREFTTSQMMDLLDCTIRRMSLMFKHHFQWSGEEAKGCQETMKRHMANATYLSTELGPYQINYYSNVPVSDSAI